MAFIGGGTMGAALASAACKGGDPQDFIVSDVDLAKAQALAGRLGCACTQDNGHAVRQARYIVFCVKPQYLHGVLDELKTVFQRCVADKEEKIIVSLVAGVASETYWKLLGVEKQDLPIIRILPNLACSIGKGFTLVMEDDSYQPRQLAEFQHILRESGGFDSLPPHQFVAGTVLTSTSPAFTAMYANALADGGVMNGLLRTQARRYALEGMLGTVQLLLESEKHLEALKDDVCSPAGPAMVGVISLEDSGFRSSVIGAVVDAYQHFARIGRIGDQTAP